MPMLKFLFFCFVKMSVTESMAMSVGGAGQGLWRTGQEFGDLADGSGGVDSRVGEKDLQVSDCSCYWGSVSIWVAEYGKKVGSLLDMVFRVVVMTIFFSTYYYK